MIQTLGISLKLRAFVVVLVFWGAMVPRISQAAVWNSHQVWSEAAEQQFSRWIRDEFQEDFFLKGDWAGLKTDCADAIYASRIIFSYLNGLPFTLGSGPSALRFSNNSEAFDHIENPIARVRAFIDFVNDKTWTGSLARHTRPIEISRASMVPGTVWLKPGHAETVMGVGEFGEIFLRGSWLPAAVRSMVTITSLGHVPAPESQHGFRRWLWPGEASPGAAIVAAEPKVLDDVTPSHFSQAEAIREFEASVQKNLAKRKEPRAHQALRRAKDFCTLVQVRSDVVRSGFDFYTSVGRKLSTAEDHAYSTPSRDANLRRLAIELGLILGNDLGKVRAALKGCAEILMGGRADRPAEEKVASLSTDDFFRNVLTLDFSSDPQDPPVLRFRGQR